MYLLALCTTVPTVHALIVFDDRLWDYDGDEGVITDIYIFSIYRKMIFGRVIYFYKKHVYCHICFYPLLFFVCDDLGRLIVDFN